MNPNGVVVFFPTFTRICQVIHYDTSNPRVYETSPYHAGKVQIPVVNYDPAILRIYLAVLNPIKIPAIDTQSISGASIAIVVETAARDHRVIAVKKLNAVKLKSIIGLVRSFEISIQDVNIFCRDLYGPDIPEYSSIPFLFTDLDAYHIIDDHCMTYITPLIMRGIEVDDCAGIHCEVSPHRDILHHVIGVPGFKMVSVFHVIVIDVYEISVGKTAICDNNDQREDQTPSWV